MIFLRELLTILVRLQWLGRNRFVIRYLFQNFDRILNIRLFYLFNQTSIDLRSCLVDYDSRSILFLLKPNKNLKACWFVNAIHLASICARRSIAGHFVLSFKCKIFLCHDYLRCFLVSGNDVLQWNCMRDTLLAFHTFQVLRRIKKSPVQVYH